MLALILGGAELLGLSVKALSMEFVGLSVPMSYTGEALVRTGIAGPACLQRACSWDKQHNEERRENSHRLISQ